MKKIITGCLLAFTVACSAQNKDSTMSEQFPIQKTNDQWKAELSVDEYRILREAGTERPGTGKYYHHHEDGTYTCAGCGNELFLSEHKYESGSGWPSFDRALQKGAVVEKKDESLGMTRIEVVCARCGGHLGHVFNDGPRETTGMRYCINSAALDFEEQDTAQK